MCGISGFLGDYPPQLLKTMNATLAHRGPNDGGALHIDGKGLGLAHRRLSIIDLSERGHQPMWDATHNVVIVFNGEIYNYRELRQDLLQDGFQFRNASDTEVLLNLYLRDSEKMLEKLNGIFSFAIWDSKRERLFLARDGVGVKPLYYCQSSKGFLFASEIKALLASDAVERDINNAAVGYYLTYLWSPAPHTMLQSVRKLEPGHAMMVREGRIQQKWQYYDLPYDRPIEKLSVDEAALSIRKHLKRAVRKQLVSDVPIGAFLSGGLDSSSVVSMAKACEPDSDLRCFTIGFKGDIGQTEGMSDDLKYAKKVAKYLGVKLDTVYVGPEMISELERMIYHLDEPEADPAALHVYFISQLARENDIKVLLSGTGGDDIFTGYRRHFALANERYWRHLPGKIRQGIRAATRSLPIKNPFCRRLKKAFQYAHLSDDERLASYFFWTDPSLLNDLAGPAIREGMSKEAMTRPLLNSISRLEKAVPMLNKMLYLEGKHFLADHNLNYTDKMSMATGVEVRVPLLDPELMQLAAQLPLQYKQHGMTGKWIFKKAMEPYLPRDVIYRQKRGFGAPLRYWLQHQMKPLVMDVLSSTSLKERGLFDPKGVQNFMKADQDGHIDGTYTIFSMVCIELWCRIFLDARQNRFVGAR